MKYLMLAFALGAAGAMAVTVVGWAFGETVPHWGIFLGGWIAVRGFYGEVTKP